MLIVALLPNWPVLPPFSRTAVELSWSLIVIWPLFVRLLLESIVTATGPATFTVEPEPMMTLSGWPLLAVEVFTGLVVEPTVVSARTGAASSSKGAAAAAESKNLRMRPRLQPRSKRLSTKRPPSQQGCAPTA